MIRNCSFLLILRRNLTHVEKREGRMFRKMLEKSNNNYNKGNRAPVLEKASSLAKGAFDGVKSSSFRRVTTLNAIFMRSITEIIATGDYASDFSESGLNITKIQVAPNFGGINVFYTLKTSDEITDVKLAKYANYLRCELSGMKVIGYVPKIYFVKDRHISMLTEIDELLKKADFGEDYQPTILNKRLHTDFKLIEESNANVINKCADNNNEEPLPVMRQDLFGVNHSEILTRILKLMKKSQASHRTEDKSTEELLKPHNSAQNLTPFEYESRKEERLAFSQFLKRQKSMKSKIRKNMGRTDEDCEYALDNTNNCNNDFYDDDDFEHDIQ